MSGGIEIIDFYRPDASRKNLFITNLPGGLADADIVIELHKIFDRYGLLYGVQAFPTQLKINKEPETTGKDTGNSGYYAFVTFYSATEATRAKESLNSVVLIGDNECKITFAKRKKEAQDKQSLYITRCYELINYYLDFNSWSYDIKTVFEDEEGRTETDHTVTLKYVCLAVLSVLDLKTDGVGVWQETYSKTDPMSRIQAVCKCKKLCHHRALENAFSKVLLIVLDSGKVHVEIDTTKPDVTNGVSVPQEQLVKVNELCDEPTSDTEGDREDTKSANVAGALSAAGVTGAQLSVSGVDDVNLHILQELEDDM